MRAWMVSISLAFLVVSTIPGQATPVCTLLMDARTAALLLEEGDCTTRVTPASTFKVPLAVMAYDAGVLKDAHEPVMAFRPGDPDWGGANWTRDTDPTGWMRFSVLWYSQRITHSMGADALTQYARGFGYGNADFSGDPDFSNGLERAWIASSLQVSPREQASFLRALVLDDLPVRARAMESARQIVESNQVGKWVIHGKTGAAYPRRADRSFDYARSWGWYIGWAKSENRTLIFVSLTQATERSSTSPGLRTRDEFLHRWPDLIERK